MATRVEQTRTLVSTRSIAFIRPITLVLRLSNARPNARINVFFDSINVNDLCQQNIITNGVTAAGNNINRTERGSGIITDTAGGAIVFLSVPGGRFNTGARQIILTDAPTVQDATIAGQLFGSATATFTSTGVFNTFSNVNNTITTVGTAYEFRPAPIQNVGDPLAQSFFTYGVAGGVFITAIEVFFKTKDTTLPVRLDVREMVNGYPKSLVSEDTDYIIVKPASEINVQANASVGTRFEFPHPVFLESNKDYCFVLASNSSVYTVWTAKMGERATETNNTIYEQPYIGSLFKSENNITWITEPSEDLKFKIYKANFSTNSGYIKFTGSPNYWGIPGTQFTTTINSDKVLLTMNVKHGLRPGDQVNIIGAGVAQYNGIVDSSTIKNFTGLRTVNSIRLTEYAFEYTAGAIAQTSGAVTTGGKLTNIRIISGGTGYVAQKTVVRLSVGGVTVQTRVNVVNGTVSSIDILDGGHGFDVPPIVYIENTAGGTGVGAAAEAYIDAMFSVQVNAPMTQFIPDIRVNTFDQNDIITSAAYKTYEQYIQQNTDVQTTTRTILPVYSLIKSTDSNAFELTYNIKTTNPNVQPTIDLRNTPSMLVYQNNLTYAQTPDERDDELKSIPVLESQKHASRYITKIIIISDIHIINFKFSIYYFKTT